MPDSEVYAVFRSRVREAIAISGLTQKKVARRSGMHRVHLCRMLKGQHDPSLGTAAKVANALGLTLNKLLSLGPLDTVPTNRRDSSKYDRFFDGRAWKLTLGEDCPADMNIAQNAIRVTANRRGIKIVVRQCKAEGAIYVQAQPQQDQGK